MSLTTTDIGLVRDVVIEALEAIVLPRFDEHDERFDRLESRMDSMESRMDSMESQMVSLEGRVGSLEQAVAANTSAIRRLEDRIETLENDVKEIYSMLADVQNGGKKFSRLTLEQKLRLTHRQVLAMAKEAGVTLE